MARDWLTETDYRAICARIEQTRERYVDIALDYLITESMVKKIAKKAGLRRKGSGFRKATWTDPRASYEVTRRIRQELGDTS